MNYSKLGLPNYRELWKKHYKECNKLLDEFGVDEFHNEGLICKSYKILIDAFLFRYNIYTKLLPPLPSGWGGEKYVFMERGEFEKSEDYKNRIKNIENEFNNDSITIEKKIQKDVIKLFKKFTQIVTQEKLYSVEIGKYYSDNECLQLKLYLPEIDLEINMNPNFPDYFKPYIRPPYKKYDLPSNFFYRAFAQNDRGILSATHYNYFVKIPIDIAEETVKNIRKGNRSVSVSFKIEFPNKIKEKSIPKFLVNLYENEIIDTKRKRFKLSFIPDIDIDIDRFKLQDTLTKKTFTEFNKGDYHKNQSLDLGKILY